MERLLPQTLDLPRYSIWEYPQARKMRRFRLSPASNPTRREEISTQLLRRIDIALLISKIYLPYLLYSDTAVIPRPVLTILVFALPLLVVAFSVLMGGSALAAATEDTPGAQALRWVAIGVLILTVVDIVLLVGVLGLNALGRGDNRSDSDV